MDNWISVSERLPKNEQDVLVCVKRKHYAKPDEYIRFVSKAFYTDGKHNTEHTCYCWDAYNLDYDEKADAYIISEGWWESVDYNEEFGMIDDYVTHWMPLPDLPE